jgi:hypothetical protein
VLVTLARNRSSPRHHASKAWGGSGRIAANLAGCSRSAWIASTSTQQ